VLESFRQSQKQTLRRLRAQQQLSAAQPYIAGAAEAPSARGHPSLILPTCPRTPIFDQNTTDFHYSFVQICTGARVQCLHCQTPCGGVRVTDISPTQNSWNSREDDETDPVLKMYRENNTSLEEENALLKRRLAALERRHESVLSQLGQLKSDVETLGLLCLEEFISVQVD